MSQQPPTASPRITLDAIEAIVAAAGYQVSEGEEEVLTIREPESQIVVQAALQENVLFFTLPCLTVPAGAITPAVMRVMLSAENGISTSGFQLYERPDGQIVISLNNFCKLQQLEADDRDDILSCIEFLIVDVVEARRLLSDLTE